MKNINTQSETVPQQLNGVWNPPVEMLRVDGWRDVPALPDVAPNYTRVSITFVEGDGVTGQWAVVDRLTADIDAERAQAEAIRKATPIIYDQPIQARIETPASDGHVYGVEVDPVDGELFAEQRQSTRLDQATYEANKAAKQALRQAHRNRIAAIKIDLDQVESALDQVDVTTTGTLGVAITATTGVNKTALQEVRKVLVDVKAAAKNLRQACEKLRKEVK